MNMLDDQPSFFFSQFHRHLPLGFQESEKERHFRYFGNWDMVRSATHIFSFVEEVETQEVESDFMFNFSGVELEKFISIEQDFGVCDPNSEDDRTRRRNLLIEQFGSAEDIWNLRLTTEGGNRIDWLKVLFQPSTWHVLLLDVSPGLSIVREEFNDPDLKLIGVAPVHPYYVIRLEEIFSLNHLQEIGFDEEEPNDKTPSPFSPPQPPFTEDVSLQQQRQIAAMYSSMNEASRNAKKSSKRKHSKSYRKGGA